MKIMNEGIKGVIEGKRKRRRELGLPERLEGVRGRKGWEEENA